MHNKNEFTKKVHFNDFGTSPYDYHQDQNTEHFHCVRVPVPQPSPRPPCLAQATAGLLSVTID